ncbi:MAG: glycosyltransferase family 39 protein, partial [Chitinophagales bacterium]|nr:glycosyltransferase family 39 protein [Chitinophagales bacterium]
MIRWFKKELDWIALGILFICCLPLFVNLGTAPIYMWDEATYANNSIDMYLYHDPIVVRMEGEPDLYNTKPPFVLWMQTLSMQIFGMNEFAIRLPSAVLSALTMLLLLLFSIKVLHSYQIGFISILTLACSNGYVSNHGARSGDLDASLVFWTTLYVLACIKFLIERKEIAIHLAFFSLGVIGAFLSKGVAGYFFLPFLVIIALINRNLTSIIKEKIFYISIITIVTVCGGYYLLREQAAAGYWDVIIQSELSRYG